MIGKVALLITALVFNVGALAKEQVTLTPALLKDNSGLVYIGYPVPESVVAPYLVQLRKYVGDTSFKILRHNQASRDHDSFHITLINPYEHPDVASIDIADIPALRFDLIGLGQAAKKDNQTYFVVAASTKAQNVRAKHGLKTKDFHVTLGFNKTDVFGVRKDASSLIKP